MFMPYRPLGRASTVRHRAYKFLLLSLTLGCVAVMAVVHALKSVKGQVDQSSLIDTTKAGALAELTIAAIIAGDRPGGGCDAAIPFIEQGAAALGFAPTFALPNGQ
jgi:hypothetical protein